MNAQETLILLEALRSGGVTHFKSQDFEVSFGKANDRTAIRGTSAPLVREGKDPGHQDSPENKEATEKIKALIETMKLDDASLIDKIFPAGAGG